MKIKIFCIILLTLILSISFSFEANAACCVSTCDSPNNAGKCTDGTNPDARDCKIIDSCKSKTASQTPATSTTSTTTIPFANPIGFTSVSQLLNAVLKNLMGLVAVVAVVFIVIGGVMYMMSGGNEAMVTKAKKTWTGAVIGLAIALAAPTFLKEIQAILGGGASGGAENWVSNALTIRQIAQNVLNLLLSIMGILAVATLIIGGGMYLTAYGDDKKIETGKKIITYAIIGIVVSLAALIIVRQVGNLMGAQFK